MQRNKCLKNRILKVVTSLVSLRFKKFVGVAIWLTWVKDLSEKKHEESFSSSYNGKEIGLK